MKQTYSNNTKKNKKYKMIATDKMMCLKSNMISNKVLINSNTDLKKLKSVSPFRGFM